MGFCADYVNQFTWPATPSLVSLNRDLYVCSTWDVIKAHVRKGDFDLRVHLMDDPGLLIRQAGIHDGRGPQLSSFLGLDAQVARGPRSL